MLCKTLTAAHLPYHGSLPNSGGYDRYAHRLLQNRPINMLYFFTIVMVLQQGKYIIMCIATLTMLRKL